MRYKGGVFRKAIEKYGWDNFEHEIVAENLTKDEASLMEQTLINKLNSLAKNNTGYNVTGGGIEGEEICYGKEICLFDENLNLLDTFISHAEASEKTGQCESSIRQSINSFSFTSSRRLWFPKENLIDNKIPKSLIEKIDRKNLGEPVYQFLYDKKTRKITFLKEFNNVTDAANAINSYPTNIRYSIKTNGTCKGYIFRYKKDIDDLENFIISYVHPKIIRPTKAVYRISYDHVAKKYSSINEIIEENPHMLSNTISQCCLGYIPSAYGYFWIYEKDVDDVNLYMQSLNFSILEKSIPVLQFDLKGNLIKEYASAFDASKEDELFNSARILLCCRHKQKTSNGYVWRFKYDKY